MIDDLISYAIMNGGFMELDRQYLKNKWLELLGKDLPSQSGLSAKQTAEALAKNATDNEALQYILFCQLLDGITPPPSVINALFSENYQQSPQEACDYYFTLMQNIGFFETMYAKTQVDFLDFYAEGNLVSMNNRFIRMNLSNQSWGFQFLPNPDEQIGMIFPEYPAQYSTLAKVLAKLFEITQVFPNYEISTGSAWFETRVLKKSDEQTENFELKDFPLIEGSTSKNSLQLASYNIEELITLAKIFDYQSYSKISGWRDTNQFFLAVHFKDENHLATQIKKIGG